MRPMTLSERDVANPGVGLRDLLSGRMGVVKGATDFGLREYVNEIVSSGFPAVRSFTGRALRLQLDGYVRRIIDTDFEEQGHLVRRPETLERWMAAYAAAVATETSFEKLRDAATSGQGEKPSKKTTQPYREILERLWIVDPVSAWRPSKNYLSRLGQPPKHHLADPALASRLLGLDAEALLRGGRGRATDCTRGRTTRPVVRISRYPERPRLRASRGGTCAAPAPARRHT